MVHVSTLKYLKHLIFQNVGFTIQPQNPFIHVGPYVDFILDVYSRAGYDAKDNMIIINSIHIQNKWESSPEEDNIFGIYIRLAR
jgi:hypothetical protein